MVIIMHQARIVDQREIQRRGGVCAKIPTACIVASLIDSAGIGRDIVVLDLTYGEGRFWAATKPRLLIGADIRVYNWVVDPDIFIKKPAWAAWRIVANLGVRVDIVAVDPPWVHHGSDIRRQFGTVLALGTPEIILESALRAANGLGARYMLVHYKKQWAPKGWEIIDHVRFMPVTRYNNYSKSENTTWFGIMRRQ